MPDKDDSNPENANPTPGSDTAVQSSTPDSETTPESATEGSPAWQTKPKSGKVTVDETKRFLVEVVASHSLSGVGDEIASAIKEIEPGGILIVDDLSWAVNDIFYLDLRKKLRMLLQWTQAVEKDCQDFLKPQVQPEEPVEGETEEVRELKEKNRELLRRLEQTRQLKTLGSLSPAGTALAAHAVGITAGLQAIGDIIGYFRTDYEIKGQTLANVEDLYIQAMVAKDLIRQGKDVYLLNFNFINQSGLIDKLGQLLKQKYNMLSCSEKVKSEFVDGAQARIEALEKHLESLRSKLIEYLVKVDEDIIQTLETKIDEATNQLTKAEEQRTPDSQITALETHLSNLRTKLVDELIEDIPAAKTAVEKKIEEIIKKLENKDAPDKKLSEVEVKALNDELKLWQAKLVDLVVGTSNNTTEILKQEVEQVTDLLKKDQRSTRLPDSQIIGLEEHLASLRTKLVEGLVRNDNDAKASLQTVITETMQEIDELQKNMGEASGIVNKSTKVNDAIDAFVSAITTVPTGGSYPPLVTACIREHLSDDKIRYILKIKLISSGADFITEEPPFYSRVVKTSYMGGGVVSYVMAEKEGRIVASGTVAGVSALEHRIGKEPELLDWRICSRESNTPGRMTSLFLDLLIASSILYMLLALIGAVIAIGENRPAAAGGLSTSLSAVQAFLYGNGTALSPPLYQLIIQAIFTGLALRRDRWGTIGVIGLTVLGLLFGIGMLAEPILSEIFSPDAINLLKIVLGAGLIIVPFTMMVLGLSEWRRRGAEN